jgi:hypothetical protein
MASCEFYFVLSHNPEWPFSAWILVFTLPYFLGDLGKKWKQMCMCFLGRQSEGLFGEDCDHHK